ncbi:MAG: NHLP bacteriocin system secretion protein [Kiritimatiellae bacterium]|nr:NHLP bacteriocin system secretion protein [Kiritimatiellia bacterium]MDD5521992.1 NHLP bacteriocin system secretion protein [Kiritimatiellia bacterium]
MAEGLFREKALKNLSVVDDVNILVQITSPKGWIALAAVGGLLVCALAWGIWGRIPVRVNGQGILMKADGLFRIITQNPGKVQNIFFREGESVHNGQVVALLEQPDLAEKVKNARLAVLDLETKYNQTKFFETENLRLGKESLTQQRSIQERSIVIQQNLQNMLAKRLADEKKLADEGLITRQQCINTQQELDNAGQEISNIKNKLHQLEIQQLQLTNQQKQELTDLENRINESKRALSELERAFRDASQVISTRSGVVTEVTASEGGSIERGSPLMTIAQTGRNMDNMKAVLYFSAADGKRIKTTMKMKVAPASIKPEDYGYMLGLVTHVSMFPASRQGMMQIFANDDMVAAMFANGPPIEVHAELVMAANTPSGFMWSSGKGPNTKILVGTICSGSAIVEEKRPIELVIPYIKRKVLGVGES